MTGTMPDLAEWLGSYGLSQYAQAFSENNIDYSILPELTENDLKNIGISSLGHRKKLLKAIRELVQAPIDTTGTVSAASGGSGTQPRETEFRQVTVVFTDLVGSTQLSENLDPEDLQELIGAYRKECGEAIRRYGGEVAHYFGDGVMAIWGYPNARENDAVSAIRAALDIVSAVPAIAGPANLNCRVGICSGPAVVGEIGDGGGVDAVGEALNIAARLQALAAANTVLISESTRRLVSAAFSFQDLGFRELKGVTAPVQVYCVLSAKTTASRFEAAHPDVLTPFIGRSGELRLLLDRWQKAKEGDGQVVFLWGIPGVGKSRLLHEIKLNLQPEPHTLLYHEGSPYHAQSAFAPVIAQIESAAQLTKRDSDAEKLAKLEEYLPDLPDRSVEPVLLIARLLAVAPGNRPELSGLSPQQIKNRTISVLIDTITAFAVQRPTLCIFEDAHWLDPSTLELLELISSRIDRARVLLVVSCRPEFRPAWINYANTTTLSLNRLSHSEGAALIHNLLKGEDLPQTLLDKIIEKADGVPLFMEELTRSLWNAPARRGGEQAEYRTSPRVPDTLSDALMERLDRVAPSRHLAQVAAVIGREFSVDLLIIASHVDESSVLPALTLLEQADIICRVQIWPGVRFAFKHALLRDAIYDSMLKSKRQHIHAEIAAALERHLPDIADNQPEILAHHHQEANNHERAIQYWFKAGQRAQAQSANIEAIADFRKALRLLLVQHENPEQIRQLIHVQLAMGIPLIAVQGYASVETREAFSQARALCLQTGDISGYFQALFGLWGHAWMSGKNDEALQMADEFMSRARELSDPVPTMVAHRIMGSTLLTIGDFQSSARHFQETIALSSGEGKQPLSNLYMVEPQAASLLLKSWDLYFLGYPDQSLSCVSEGLELAYALGHPYTIAFAYYMTSVVHLWRGEARLAFEHADKCYEISTEQRFTLYVVLSKISRGRAAGELGRSAEGRAEVLSGIGDARRNGIGFMLPMMDSWLADMHAQAGESDRALSIVEDVLGNLGEVTGRSWEAELHRQRAQFVLANHPSKLLEAESYLRKAVDVARAQFAKSLELRAVTSLAELWQTQGRSDEARAVLEPVCSWFNEGAETVDIQRARNLQVASL
ncbi:MAG: adenylate/guanylate cyclase domain-containing protein [Tardiphaga sp.]